MCAERIGSEIPFSATATYPCPCVVSFKQKRLALHACNLGDKKEGKGELNVCMKGVEMGRLTGGGVQPGYRNIVREGGGNRVVGVGLNVE